MDKPECVLKDRSTESPAWFGDTKSSTEEPGHLERDMGVSETNTALGSQVVQMSERKSVQQGGIEASSDQGAPDRESAAGSEGLNPDDGIAEEGARKGVLCDEGEGGGGEKKAKQIIPRHTAATYFPSKEDARLVPLQRGRPPFHL